MRGIAFFAFRSFDRRQEATHNNKYNCDEPSEFMDFQSKTPIILQKNGE